MIRIIGCLLLSASAFVPRLVIHSRTNGLTRLLFSVEKLLNQAQEYGITDQGKMYKFVIDEIVKEKDNELKGKDYEKEKELKEKDYEKEKELKEKDYEKEKELALLSQEATTNTTLIKTTAKNKLAYFTQRYDAFKKMFLIYLYLCLFFDQCGLGTIL
jgi:hypothetical protein